MNRLPGGVGDPASSHGFVVGRITLEAKQGGLIALIKNGDQITIDAEKRTITLDVPASEIKTRKAEWKAPPRRPARWACWRSMRSSCRPRPKAR